MDMVSRNDGTRSSRSYIPVAVDGAAPAGCSAAVGHADPLRHDRPIHKAGSVEDWTDQSDQGVFAERGVAFVYFGVRITPTITSRAIRRTRLTRDSSAMWQT